jgi:enoyl-CoA hydratase/carnithine racemase
MTDVFCRIEGQVGRITLNRPDVLNALTHEMCLTVEAALDEWRDVVRLVIIEAAGDKAFCAGGDIASLYASAQRGDIAYGRKFWQDEYRLNTKIAEYTVPIVSFLQGFTMGGGVGLGCHASHRIVCETSKIAMPECGIGLLPDVGGSLLLANAPGQLGRYLGLTGARMGPGDAIFVGFADAFVPYEQWDALKGALIETGDIDCVSGFFCVAPVGVMVENQSQIDHFFGPDNLDAIATGMRGTPNEFAQRAFKGFSRGAPLAMACCMAVLDAVRGTNDLRAALALEYRFTARAVAQGDFPEGVRAAIIDKDNQPKWAHAEVSSVTQDDVDMMLSDLGADALNLETT